MTILLWVLVVLALVMSFFGFTCALAAFSYYKKLCDHIDGLALVVNAQFESVEQHLIQLEKRANFRVIK